MCCLSDDNWDGSEAREPCVSLSDAQRVAVNAFQPSGHEIIRLIHGGGGESVPVPTVLRLTGKTAHVSWLLYSRLQRKTPSYLRGD